MDTMRAFAMGEANRGKELKVFDWEKAARLIRERSPESVWAGLSGDWECDLVVKYMVTAGLCLKKIHIHILLARGLHLRSTLMGKLWVVSRCNLKLPDGTPALTGPKKP
jgi:hypothetical protein